MDSNPDKKAKGAHVIIKAGLDADGYDNALAKFLGDMFPGRSNKIVGRSDLANVNRAATKGYNYRLVECGFISNAGDVKIFNGNIDSVAKGILEAFDIKTQATPLWYRAHVSGKGWLDAVNGCLLYTSGISIRIAFSGWSSTCGGGTVGKRSRCGDSSKGENS